MPNFFKEPVIPEFNTSENICIKKGGFIEFSQRIVTDEINSGKLKKINIRYNGLCEIICNLVLLNDLLGESPLPIRADVMANWLNTQPGHEQLGIRFKKNTNFVKNCKNKYGELITLKNLESVENTHILEVTSFFSRLIAVLFSIYPCNLFSNSPFGKPPYDHIKLRGKTLTCVDKSMLSERLNQLETGFYIKFFAFQKRGLSMRGHSMLIKKINEKEYSFFDPNHGEYLNLDFNKLAEKINQSVAEHDANQMVFLDAKDFFDSYQIKQIAEKKESMPGFRI